MNRFRQPYCERAALTAVSDTLAVLNELIGRVEGCITRPQGGRVLGVYSSFFSGVDAARRDRDMFRLQAECRAAKGLALDVLCSSSDPHRPAAKREEHFSG